MEIHGTGNGLLRQLLDLTTLNSMISNGDDVTKVVTSLVTDMSYMFYNNSTFNQDISAWDVSNVTNMVMFAFNTAFNQTLVLGM